MELDNSGRVQATVERRLAEIHDLIEREREFREFAATNALDWEMSDARLEGLRAEKRELESLVEETLR